MIVMPNGRIVEQGPVDAVVENPKTEDTRRPVKVAVAIAAQRTFHAQTRHHFHRRRFDRLHQEHRR
ncbi:MAG: hypothetical protein B7Z04_13020, partial [Rhodobacterales bacterium 32-66-9]